MITLVSFPSLKHVDAAFYFQANTPLTRVDVPVLTFVKGTVQVANNPALTEVYFPSLQYVGEGFQLSSNTNVARLNLPSLTVLISSLGIYTNSMLTLMNVPLLTYIGGTIQTCESNAAFTLPQPPNAPAGGLVVTGTYKNMANCRMFSGTTYCLNPYTTCP
jgi:hypothetical protein